MKPEPTLPEDSDANARPAGDESPTAKVRKLRPVMKPYAWDPYEVWRTRVKPKGNGDSEPSK